jgi:hypothetical protein
VASIEEDGAAAAAATVIRDLGRLFDSGAGADVVFRVDGEDIPAHRSILMARSPVFATILAERWGAAAAASSSSSDAAAPVPLDGTNPLAFKQLLRFLYTGRCEAGALDAMADHLFAAAAQFGVDELQALASRALVAKLAPETVCDYFALAHAHDDDELADACAVLLLADMLAVTQSAGFQRLSTERPLLLAALMQCQAKVMATPDASSRKRKREGEGEGEGEGGAGARKEVLTADKVKRLKVGELRTELASRGLATAGVKADLAARLEAAL